MSTQQINLTYYSCKQLLVKAQKMKIILLTLTLTAVIFALELDPNDPIFKLNLECGKELSLDNDTLEAVAWGKMRDTTEFKCFQKCMYEKFGFINSKGEVQTGNFSEAVHKDDVVRKTILKCQHIVVATCDDALVLEKCNDDNIPRTTERGT